MAIADAPRPNRRRRPAERQSLRETIEGTATYEKVVSAGEMGRLLTRTAREAVRPPFPWWKDAVVEFSVVTRRGVAPLVISLVAYTIGYVVFFFGGVVQALGVSERMAAAVTIASYREVAVWITTMVLGGIAGSSIAADLGARKVREEIDALSVLGVDQVRTLVVPRVAALTLLFPTIGLLLGIVLFIGTPGFVAPPLLDFPREVYVYNAIHSVYLTDIFAFIVKMVIIGVFVGVVACHKGLTSKGGAEGVGKAVNETVVICFFGIWLLNFLFTLAYLTSFPQTAVLRG